MIGAPASSGVRPDRRAGAWSAASRMFGSRMVCVTDAGDLFEVHDYTSRLQRRPDGSGFRYMVFWISGPWLDSCHFNGVRSSGDQSIPAWTTARTTSSKGGVRPHALCHHARRPIPPFDIEGISPVFMGGKALRDTRLRSGAVGIASRRSTTTSGTGTDPTSERRGHARTPPTTQPDQPPLPRRGNYSTLRGWNARTTATIPSQPGESTSGPTDYRPNTAAQNTYTCPAARSAASRAVVT